MRARRKAAVRVHPGPGISVVFGILGAAAYLSTVVFAVGEGLNTADVTATKIVLGVAGLLSAAGLCFALAGLRRRRGAALFGLLLCAAFLAFAALSMLRS